MDAPCCKLGLVVISRDARILQRPAEVQVFLESGLRTFWLSGRTDPAGSDWTYLGRPMRFWSRMEQTVAERGTGPWAYAITETKIVGLPVPVRKRQRMAATADRPEPSPVRRQLKLGL